MIYHAVSKYDLSCLVLSYNAKFVFNYIIYNSMWLI
jgi:hypothetical protein